MFPFSDPLELTERVFVCIDPKIRLGVGKTGLTGCQGRGSVDERSMVRMGRERERDDFLFQFLTKDRGTS